MKQTTNTNVVPEERLTEDKSGVIHALVETCGERLALQQLGIGRQVLYRALAGLSVRRGSIALIERALERIAPLTTNPIEGGASE